MSLQVLDQSKKEPIKEAGKWSSDLSKSSKVRQLCSFQIHHIKHNETKFQMLDECFPNQFHQPKRKSSTDLERTHGIPKVLKTKLHKRWAFRHNVATNDLLSPHNNDTWCTSQQNQNPYSANYHTWESYPRHLSKQKKETRLGALTFQIPFQEKTMEEEPYNLW